MGKWTENPEPVPPGEGEPSGEPETGGTHTHSRGAPTQRRLQRFQQELQGCRDEEPRTSSTR